MTRYPLLLIITFALPAFALDIPVSSDPRISLQLVAQEPEIEIGRASLGKEC